TEAWCRPVVDGDDGAEEHLVGQKFVAIHIAAWRKTRRRSERRSSPGILKKQSERVLGWVWLWVEVWLCGVVDLVRVCGSGGLGFVVLGWVWVWSSMGRRKKGTGTSGSSGHGGAGSGDGRVSMGDGGLLDIGVQPAGTGTVLTDVDPLTTFGPLDGSTPDLGVCGVAFPLALDESRDIADDVDVSLVGEMTGTCIQASHSPLHGGLYSDRDQCTSFVNVLRRGDDRGGIGGGSGGCDGGRSGGPGGQGSYRVSMGKRSSRGHVIVPESVVEMGARTFATTLVGLILGHCLPLTVVERLAMRLWAIYGIRRVRAFRPGQLLLEFDSTDRFPTLLERSPWTIARRPVLLRHWAPDMSFEDLQPRTLSVWVKFSGMPTSLYIEVGLGLIASSFGKPVLMDQVTRSGTRLRFARFLVELEAATPIEREVTFELPGGATFTVSAEYAFMPPQCCECRVFGHGSSRCPKRARAGEEAGPRRESGSQGMPGLSSATPHQSGTPQPSRLRTRRGAPRVASPPPRVAASVVRLPPPVETSNPFWVFSDTGEVDIEVAAFEEELPVRRTVGDEVDVPTFPHSRSPTQIGGGTHVVGDDFALEDGGVRPTGEEGLFSSGAGVPSVSNPERSGEHTSDSQAYNITRFVILEPSPLIMGPEKRSASLTPLPLAILPPSRQYGEGLDRDP
ncbi:hypothetical protein Drorol1_Dr00013957, partial [Drosera rotundifolia]